MSLEEVFAENMRAIRHITSQEKFARELQIAKSTVQAIESRTSSAKLDTVGLIAARLNIPPLELLTEHPGNSLYDWAAQVWANRKVKVGSLR